jgi:ribosome-associated protein
MATDRPPRKRAASRPKTSTPRRKTTLKSSKVGKTPKTPKAPRKAAARVPDDVMVAVSGAQDKKAEHLTLLDLRGGLAFTDFFVICTGNTSRQVQAIAEGVQEALRKRGERPALIEGYQRGEWVLLDYFDFIVHIFTPATRDFYALERLWGDAQRVEISA